ncbi:SMC-Scp complex subunit ScpB [Flammeovirgaceae bacterium SG7u.111]|nr:SMC-Scp complex subunit ScpB [Flammeovirgaceae bacterium SG7u.132]WPO33096.1 SMC-Scp complex subunit ScpB [Flammeovirgaceae bacterium SG7u.111]
MDYLQKHLEALIFCSPQPVKAVEMQNCMSEMFDTEVPIEDIEKSVELLGQKYASEEFAMEIVKAGDGFQFMTKPAYQASIGVLLKQKSKRKLSLSSLETLSIVAYKQPVTKSQLEQIRGVNCDYAIKKLLEKGLLEIRGKSDGVGRPMLYGTSPKFLEYFGINNVNELPVPKDFEEDDNEIGKTEE